MSDKRLKAIEAARRVSPAVLIRFPWEHEVYASFAEPASQYNLDIIALADAQLEALAERDEREIDEAWLESNGFRYWENGMFINRELELEVTKTPTSWVWHLQSSHRKIKTMHQLLQLVGLLKTQ